MFPWLLSGTVFTKQVQSRLQELLPALFGAFVDNQNYIWIPNSNMSKKDVGFCSKKLSMQKMFILKADQSWPLNVRYADGWVFHSGTE